MGLQHLSLQRISFVHASASVALFEDLSLEIPRGWTGIVGVNGCGKTTLLRLACGQLEARRGRCARPSSAILCEQRVDEPPPLLGDFLQAEDALAGRMRARLVPRADIGERWDSASPGERKRAQVAVALWQEPELLALDEPTNHLDAAARALILEALRGHHGVGLIVSHDRDLLDELCDRCLFLDPPDARVRPGGFSAGRREAERERAEREHAHESARREVARLSGELAARRSEAARADARRSKSRLARGDSDGRERLDRARVTGKDAVAGGLTARMSARVGAARASERALRQRPTYETGVDALGTRAPRETLLHLPEGRLPLGPEAALEHPTLAVRRDARVAITGANGAGKSTLVRALLGAGGVPADRMVVVEQEMSGEQGRRLLREARSLPGPALGRLLNLISRLGSVPERLLESEDPSPGEARKLQLALGLQRETWLIVADEPTNHLDLPSVEALESALSSFAGALVLVSHDERFLERTTTERWRIERRREGAVVVRE